jgi:hypothetical protein
VLSSSIRTTFVFTVLWNSIVWLMID